MRIGRETKRGLRQARKLLHLCLPISGNSSAESEWGPWGEAYRLVRTPDSRGGSAVVGKGREDEDQQLTARERRRAVRETPRVGAEGKGRRVGVKLVGEVEGEWVDGLLDGCGKKVLERKEGPEKRKEEPNRRDAIGAFRSQRLAVYN